MLLDGINDAKDIKRLAIDELCVLCDEIRQVLINKLSNTGGHVGSNLGVVELTAALHYVFDSPYDKIIWDVSHQCYAHKILTGRKDAFIKPEMYKTVTGFTNKHESGHDFFTVGHTSTSVSAALGFARSRDTLKGKENIIAVIGDGALGGGQALEGINTLGEYEGNFILIINDNNQSVAENHGGLYKHLKALRDTEGESPDNIFRCFGLEYHYLGDGHDVKALTRLFEKVKDITHPVVLHIHTLKGKGLPYAEENKEDWHSGAPFFIADGTPKNGYPVYDTTVFDSLENLLDTDPSAIVLTAGTPRALGYVGEKRESRAKEGRFIDVGIAEQNAMGIAGGIAGYGGNAVFGVYAPFLQRAYDQLSHDICLNSNPVTLLVLLPGAYGMKSNTHLGLCDIQLLSHIPNLIYLCPCDKQEYLAMLRYATAQKEYPVAIRVPCRFYEGSAEDDTDYSDINRARVMKQGKDCALIATGSLIPKAMEAARRYKEVSGRDITVINPRFLTGIDASLLWRLKKDHSLVITWEDGELYGGYGQNIASYYADCGMKVLNFGITKEFHSDFNADDLLADNGISAENLITILSEYFPSGKVQG